MGRRLGARDALRRTAAVARGCRADAPPRVAGRGRRGRPRPSRDARPGLSGRGPVALAAQAMAASQELLDMHVADQRQRRLHPPRGRTPRCRSSSSPTGSGWPTAIVGQSRGGIFAKLMAIRQPKRVCGIVTLGSPNVDHLAVNPLVTRQLRFVAALGSAGVPGVLRNDCVEGECAEELAEWLAEPFPSQVPYVSVYSRRDWVVDWRACVDPDADNVEVDSSHMGMCAQVQVYELLGEPAGRAGRVGAVGATRSRSSRVSRSDHRCRQHARGARRGRGSDQRCRREHRCGDVHRVGRSRRAPHPCPARRRRQACPGDLAPRRVARA